MKKFSLSTAIFLLTAGLAAQGADFDQTHASWHKVLSEYVVTANKTTKVKYAELSKKQDQLDLYLQTVSAVNPADYNTWNEKQKLAFLFNAYNAFTLKLIVQELVKNSELKSIKKIGGVFSSPWKIKFFQFLGKESFLDDIEQNIARKNFDEPRMHFAFNCASIGCPSLQPVAFTADKLDIQLDTATRDFFKDESRNSLDTGKSTLGLSSILKWYKDDFENSKKLGPLRKFLSTYYPFTPEQLKKFETGQYDIKYLPYDWNLNAVTK